MKPVYSGFVCSINILQTVIILHNIIEVRRHLCKIKSFIICIFSEHIYQ